MNCTPKVFCLTFPLKSKGYPTCLSTYYQAVIGFTVHDMACKNPRIFMYFCGAVHYDTASYSNKGNICSKK